MNKNKVVYICTNHICAEAPYNQTRANKAFAALKNYFADDVELILNNSGATYNEFYPSFEYIDVIHTIDFDADQKAFIAKTVTELAKFTKVHGGNDVFVRFQKMNPDDFFIFEAE